jgi:hypothetical protein
MIETSTGNGKTIYLSADYVARTADRLWHQPPAQRQARIERAKARVAGKFGSRTDAAIAALAAR